MSFSFLITRLISKLVNYKVMHSHAYNWTFSSSSYILGDIKFKNLRICQNLDEIPPTIIPYKSFKKQELFNLTHIKLSTSVFSACSISLTYDYSLSVVSESISPAILCIKHFIFTAFFLWFFSFCSIIWYFLFKSIEYWSSIVFCYY